MTARVGGIVSASRQREVTERGRRDLQYHCIDGIVHAPLALPQTLDQLDIIRE